MRTAVEEWLTIAVWLCCKVALWPLTLVGLDFLKPVDDQEGTMEPSKIAKNLVKSVATGELCRLGATQISQLKPQLDANNIKLVGVGLEELGVEEFVKGKFFDGDLYIDTKKECYQKLGFKRLNIFTMLPKLFGKKTRESLSKSKEEKVDGNFQGDGWQNGGAFVIDKDGKALLTFKQDSPGEHVDPNEVLKSLGLEAMSGIDAGPPAADCDNGACALPKKS